MTATRNHPGEINKQEDIENVQGYMCHGWNDMT